MQRQQDSRIPSRSTAKSTPASATVAAASTDKSNKSAQKKVPRLVLTNVTSGNVKVQPANHLPADDIEFESLTIDDSDPDHYDDEFDAVDIASTSSQPSTSGASSSIDKSSKSSQPGSSNTPVSTIGSKRCVSVHLAYLTKNSRLNNKKAKVKLKSASLRSLLTEQIVFLKKAGWI
jgi:hypothetical protein